MCYLYLTHIFTFDFQYTHVYFVNSKYHRIVFPQKAPKRSKLYIKANKTLLSFQAGIVHADLKPANVLWSQDEVGDVFIGPESDHWQCLSVTH